MFSSWVQLLKRTLRPLTGGRRSPLRGRISRRLELEVLETRLVPAFNLTIGTAATHNVDQNAFGVFSPVGPGANIAVQDILTDLQLGKSDTITDGALGNETGNITWLAHSDLDYHGLRFGGLSLTLVGFAPGSSVTLNSNILDSKPTIAGGLNVNVSAGNDLVVAGSISAGSGTVSLAADDADVQRGGNGSDGVGTLTVGPGVAVTGTSVTLSGADVHLDTSSQPARVTATGGQINTFASGLNAPFGLAFDAQGNLYVASFFGNSVSQVTPGGTVSTFATGFNGPRGLAFDAQGNLYVANVDSQHAGIVSKVTPDGKTVSTFATGFNSPFGLAFDAQGNLYVANDSRAGTRANTVSQVTPGGTVSTFATGFDGPVGLAFDAQGNLYVANVDRSSVSQVTPGGTVSDFATGFINPVGLAFDAQGNLYVANASNVGTGTVSMVTPGGNVSTFAPFATGLFRPEGLAFAAHSLYVSNSFGGVSQFIQGSLTVRSSLPSRPISVGGPDNAVAGLNLTDAELADLAGSSNLTIGDPTQTGAITVTTAALAATNLVVQQDPAGPGQIILDDGSGAAPALADSAGSVHLMAGRGGIVAANGNNTTAEVAAASLTLDTTGPVGSATRRLQLQLSGSVVVGAANQPAGVFLDGLADLQLGNVQVAAGTPVDVTARGNLTVAGNVSSSGGPVSLAADVKPDGSGDDGVGTLAVGPGVVVTGDDVTLRGADVNLDTSSNPAHVTATSGQLQTFVSALSVNHPAGLAFDAQGNLYVANFDSNGNGIVSKVTPGGTVSTFATGFNDPFGLAFDAQGNLYVANALSNSVSQVTPDGTVSDFATGLNIPEGLAFDAQGNLYVANFFGRNVSKVSPDGKTVSTFATGFNRPSALAFDAQGNLYVADLFGSVSQVTPAGTVSTYATGFINPNGLAFDAQGNLYVTNFSNNKVSKVTPAGTVSDFATGFIQPIGVAFDAQGNLYVANSAGNSVSKVPPGSVTVRSSLPSRPISVGGSDNVVAGVNLTDAELADLAFSPSVTFGDPTQTGTITFTTATLAANFVQVRQSLTDPGAIVFDDNSQGPALSAPGAGIALTAGTGGIQEVNAGPGSNGVAAPAGTLHLNTQGPVGSFTQALNTQVAHLGASSVGGSLFLADPHSLTTIGTVTAGGVLVLNLTGDFTTHPGDLQALAIKLLFTGTGTQHFDSGGQTFASLVQAGLGTLVLRSGGLILTGDLLNVAGEFDTNNQPLTVGGLTTVDGVLATGSAPQTFTGGLIVNGTFSGGSGTVTTSGVALSAGAVLNAPAILNDTGDWSNSGGLFYANGGTVVFSGSGPQRLLSGGQPFNNLTHSGSGVLTLADDLTLAGSLTNTSGAGSVDATNRTLRVGGGWSWGNTGRFLSAGSTVVLTGANQHLSGNTTFFNLSKVVTSVDTLTFQAGSTQTVTGALTLQGAAGNPLSLRSSMPGKAWDVNPKGPRPVSFVDVQDSLNLNARQVATTSSHDSGGNTGWAFPAAGETWTGAVSSSWDNPGNWDKGFVPNAGCTVTVPGTAPVQPVLDTSVTVKNLILQGGASLTLAGHNLTDTGTFTNQCTLVLQGNESVKLASGNDNKEGTWEYVGDNTGHTLPLGVVGPTGFFNLLLDDTNALPDTFQAQAGLTVKGSLTLAGGTYDAHGFATAVAGLTTVNGGSYRAGGVVQSLGGGLAVSGGAFVGGTGVVTARGVSLTGGMLLAPSSFLKDSGDWLLSGGTFNANKGTVALTGTNQHISGSTTFFNLTKVTGAADTLTFQASSTQTVGGNLTLQGVSGGLLKLRSSEPGTQWLLQVLGSASVQFADVQDSDATGLALTDRHGKNSGDNTRWSFLP